MGKLLLFFCMHSFRVSLILFAFLQDANLRHYSGYTEEQMKPVVDLMLDYLKKPTKHEALWKKYASKKFMKASIFVRDWIEKQQKADALKKKDVDSESEPSSEESEDNE